MLITYKGRGSWFTGTGADMCTDKYFTFYPIPPPKKEQKENETSGVSSIDRVNSVTDSRL